MTIHTQFKETLPFVRISTWRSRREANLMVIVAVNPEGKTRDVMIAHSKEQAKRAISWLAVQAAEGVESVYARDAIAAVRTEMRIAKREKSR